MSVTDVSRSTTHGLTGSPRTGRPSGSSRRRPAATRAGRRSGEARVSVVVPTLNESANLPHVLPLIPAWVHEVVVVDGNSTDDSIEVSQNLRRDVRVILQEGRGKGDAIACGFAAATGDIIVMLDSDGSTDPREIAAFIDPLLKGADFVKGSRSLPGGGSHDLSRLRAAGNLLLTKIVNLLYRTRYTDLCYGYNAFWAHCLPYISVDCEGFEVETLIATRIARAGLNVAEVPSTEYERLHGSSNLNAFRDGWRVLRTILAERLRHRPSEAPAPSGCQELFAPDRVDR